jgi:hypothetical protein
MKVQLLCAVVVAASVGALLVGATPVSAVPLCAKGRADALVRCSAGAGGNTAWSDASMPRELC